LQAFISLAGDLDIGRIVIPPHPGLFSALGLLAASVEQLYTRSVLTSLLQLDPARGNAILGEMQARAELDLAGEGFGKDRIEVARFADLRYRKQISELMLPLPEQPLDAASLAALAEAFHAEHERTYGYRIRDEQVELVAFKLRARGHRRNPVEVPWRELVDTRPVARSDRLVYFGAALGELRTPVIGRADLGERPTEGPLVVEEYDSTLVVPPGWSAQRTATGFIVLEVEQ